MCKIFELEEEKITESDEVDALTLSQLIISTENFVRRALPWQQLKIATVRVSSLAYSQHMSGSGHVPVAQCGTSIK
jgi:hypothetical protein